jgi:DNA-binding transcriptional MerR regulator
MLDRQYTIDELCELTGYSRRTVRYYVQEGLIDPPAGRGRGGFYNDSHLEQLRKIQLLRDRRLSLSAISALLKTKGREPVEEESFSREVWAKTEIVPGVEISVRRDMEERSGRRIAEIIRLARTILKEDIDNEYGDEQ